MEGDAAQSILDCARENNADVIVVGTHGRSGLGKILMGSVAERVFRQSPVPVMTVGPHLHHPGRGFVPRNILLAADFTPASERAARYACALAREHNAKLTMLHVLDCAELSGVADRAEVMMGIEKELTDIDWPRRRRFAALLPRRGGQSSTHDSADRTRNRRRLVGDGRAPMRGIARSADVAQRVRNCAGSRLPGPDRARQGFAALISFFITCDFNNEHDRRSNVT